MAIARGGGLASTREHGGRLSALPSQRRPHSVCCRAYNGTRTAFAHLMIA
jgi:hypothetical protein